MKHKGRWRETDRQSVVDMCACVRVTEREGKLSGASAKERQLRAIFRISGLYKISGTPLVKVREKADTYLEYLNDLCR